ncbi:MAG: putative ABC transporter permease, partial [Clostridiales bacterium]|nr:putative ABC transporter permease [Clostridiales bacterium]
MSLPYPFVESYLMFFIYSFTGWVIEVIYYGLTEGKFINRGFLAGPLCPVYGLGFYAAIWIFEPLNDSFFIIFFGMATACTLVKLIAGVILYHTFHMRWWDYSDYKFNFRGYICLRFYVYWGIAASLGIYVLHPAVKWLIA